VVGSASSYGASLRLPGRPRRGAGGLLLAVYSARGSIPTLPPPDCQQITPDGVNGQHNGVERTSVEIIASEMIMLSGREDGDGHGEGMGEPQRAPVASGARRAPSGGDEYEDDVPF